MRTIYYCFTLILACAAQSLAEPYTALITADGVAVRSGPGIDFYPVLQLQTDDQVEVYHVQNDWCAIRPPIGSFSWVSAPFIHLDTGNIGTVLADGLASRIGSDFSDDCETIQVTLQKGESVLILERREMPENPTSPIWLKIVPPNGEFRWIHESTLGPAIRQVRYDTKTAEVPALPRSASTEYSIPVPTMPTPRVASAHSPGTATALVARQSPTYADPFQRAFGELQQEAYSTMTRPAEDAIFAALIQRAEELHRTATTDQDLEKTYHLLESLQRTRLVRRDLALRRQADIGTNPNFAPLNSSPTATAHSGTSFASGGLQRQSIIPAYSPTTAQGSLLRSGVNVGGYDIVGRLGEFEPLPKGHPPYAVVDEKEQIICLISPSANLDLSSYVGQFVGINGVLGFYEKQQGKPPARHITARNIGTIR